MKRILSFLMIAAVVSLAIVSCKDDFNEEDFLRLQAELKNKQDSVSRVRNKAGLDSTSKQSVQSYINALNEAGDLMSFTILIRDNDVPVEGATVRLTSGTPESTSDGRAKAEQTATTDASGNVTFDRVTIGPGSIQVSKQGFTTATALITLCCVAAPQPINVNVNGQSLTYYVVPEKQHSNLLLPVYSQTGTATATITGKVTIETDVTNRTPEIPQNLTIAANFTALTATTASSNVVVSQYSFQDSQFGTATVNGTTGEYTMVVPASVSAYNVTMIMPTIERNQKIAAAFVDNVAIATGPEYRDQPTTFGPNAGTYVAVPAIYGAKAVFAAPPAPGRGFSISTPTPVQRSLPVTTISNNGISTSENISFNLASRGRGFSSSPTVTIAGGGGNGAQATASLRGKILNATVSNGGTGYGAGPFSLYFVYTDANSNLQFLAGPVALTATGGVINTGNIVLPNSIGFPNGNNYTTTMGIQGFGYRIVPAFGNFNDPQAANTTPAVITFTNDNELNEVSITNGGTLFTSAPTITFNGGGTPTFQPTLTIAAFRTQWDFNLNSTNTVPYKVLPAGFTFTYAANAVDGITIESPAKVDRITGGFSAPLTNQDFINQVMTDGNNIMAINPIPAFRTTTFSVYAPTLSIQDLATTQARAFVNVSASGQVSSLENPSTGTFALDMAGSGYDSYSSFSIVPSAATAPGSGANVNLSLSSSSTTKVVSWLGGSTLLAGGSGYLDELNQLRVPFSTGIAPRTSTLTISVSAGQTTIFNYNYGSGVPKVNLEGNFR